MKKNFKRQKMSQNIYQYVLFTKLRWLINVYFFAYKNCCSMHFQSSYFKYLMWNSWFHKYLLPFSQYIIDVAITVLSLCMWICKACTPRHCNFGWSFLAKPLTVRKTDFFISTWSIFMIKIPPFIIRTECFQSCAKRSIQYKSLILGPLLASST